MPVAEIIKDAWFGSGKKAGREGESLVGLVGVGEVRRDGRLEHSEALPGKQLPLRQPLWQKGHGSLGSEDAATPMTRGRVRSLLALNIFSRPRGLERQLCSGALNLL